MKGGKDMKKIYKLDVNKEEYIVLDGEEKVFSIPKDTLCFDGEKFYEAFFKKNDTKIDIRLKKAYLEEIEKGDKFINNIYNLLNDMFKEISKEINGLDKKVFMKELE